MKISAVSIVLLCISFTSVSQIQKRNEITIEVSASVFCIDSVFTYEYIVRNESNSRQSMESILIETGDRGQRRGGTITNVSQSYEWPGGSSNIVGVPRDTSSKGSVSWVAHDSLANLSGLTIPQQSLILPGSLEKFSFSSRGYPSIKRYWAKGWIAPLTERQYDSLRAKGYTKNQIVGVWYENSYSNATVSPQIITISSNIDFLDTLLSYTRQSVTLGWLKSGRDNDCDGDEKPQDGVSKNLEKRLGKVRTELTKGNTLKATKELEKFIKKVERVSKRSEAMSSEAYALLKYNAEYLLGRIITLPARPTGTVLQQIDELKAELTRQQSKKNIGGVLLVKSLTFLADQAKKQLQKSLPSTSDSATAALSIAAFQLFVDEIWELTGVASGKGKKNLALFVYDEAYIQLHYRAKFILEALPAPRTLIDMKSVEMDDDVRKEFDAMQKMSKEQ